MHDLRIPIATFRLQFNSDFRFDDARDIVSYLDKLGITDIYASPILKSRAGSVHGYDVTDHSQINPELGGEEGFRGLTDVLRQRNMGLIADVVPNHMGIDDPSNRWWQDVLEHGLASAFASAFDIDWRPPKRDLSDRVLLPVLGDQFGRVLENGQIRLSYDSGAFWIDYFDHRYPVDPRTSAQILETVVEHVRITSDPDDPELIELESILTALRHLPERTTGDPHQLDERRREARVAKRRLNEVTESSAAVRRAIEGVVVDWCGRVGEPGSFGRLEELLSQQVYRLCYWRVAADEINYRRFFDINDLAAIRVEDDVVFAAVHETILRMVGEGRITGLRIDHPDGLYDPEDYFAKLQNECSRVIPEADSTVARLSSGIDSAIYCVAEKILGRHEQMPLGWAVHGTTGYEMLNLINGLFVDPRGRLPLERYYAELCERIVDFEDLVYECKKLILNVSMSAELHVLARRLDRVSEQHRWSRDFTLWGLHEALREAIACFPVYRTYVRRKSTEVNDEDRRHVDIAMEAAKRRNPSVDRSIFDFVRSVLLLDEPDGLDDQQRVDRREFVMKMQQLTAPIMAKGLEDTAFYRVYPLVSLNEVGGEPDQFDVSLDEFHRHNAVRCARWPYGMIASSTHDSKRSEDVRAWINVLSEMPDIWAESVEHWRQLNHKKKIQIDGRSVPDHNEEYLLYQTLVGVWPLSPLTDVDYLGFIGRIVAYMEKALREAKVHTSWVSPDTDYEQAVGRFVHSILERDPDNAFVDELQQFHDRLNYPGMCNALGQTLLKLTVPGVPDIYQGCELWNFSLVDPDNRQPVDFTRRRELLENLMARENEDRAGLVADLLEHWADGRVKFFTTMNALRHRRAHPEIFLEGEYIVPPAVGTRAEHVCAFIRRSSSAAALVVVPLHTVGMTRGEHLPVGPQFWEDTRVELPTDVATGWTNVFTGQSCHAVEGHEKPALEVAQVLDRFPVALLESTG